MKIHYLLIVLPVLGLSSCDKIKNLASKASKTSKETTADTALMKLVDQTPEGVIFRKDLPFPNSVSVTITRKAVMSGQYSERSELGKQTNAVRGTSTTITKLDRADDKVTYSLVKSNFEKPLTKEEVTKKKAPEITETAPPTKEPYVFVKSGSTWKAANATDFRIAAVAQEICPVFDQLLTDNGLAPPAQWFGKHRIKIGDSLTINDKNLNMFFAGTSTGTLKLTLESISEVSGHPCGLFAISGRYARKNFPDLQGNLSSEDVTIQSGKIWASLLYPLVLRMEADMIASQRGGSPGGLVTGIQGSVLASKVLDWKTTGP
jgi:hypothetical protein